MGFFACAHLGTILGYLEATWHLACSATINQSKVTRNALDTVHETAMLVEKSPCCNAALVSGKSILKWQVCEVCAQQDGQCYHLPFSTIVS